MTSFNVPVLLLPSPDRRRWPKKRMRVYRWPPEMRRGCILAAMMVALAPWARPPTRGARTGAALATSDREDVDATCRSTMAPWVIKRAEMT